MFRQLGAAVCPEAGIEDGGAAARVFLSRAALPGRHNQAFHLHAGWAQGGRTGIITLQLLVFAGHLNRFKN